MKNRYKVPKRQWAKWTDNARFVFNNLYGNMSDQSFYNAHPKTEKLPKEPWMTVRWNAAWMAADMVARREKQ